MSSSGTIGRNSARPAVGAMAALVLGLAAGRADAQVACGDLLAPGSTTTLTADVGPCDGVDAAIVVDSAILDLGGRTVSCADTNGDGTLSEGVVLLGKNAEVRNGTISGCAYGVDIYGAGKHVVEGLTIVGSEEDGVWVGSDTKKNRFTGNTVSGSGDDGFEVRSAKNTLSGNVVQNNGEDGIDVVEAKANKILQNTSSGNFDDGIDLNGVANKVIGNTAEGNGGYGIAVVGKRNKIVGNSASGSGAGIDIAGSDCSGNVWKKNTIGMPGACVQ